MNEINEIDEIDDDLEWLRNGAKRRKRVCAIVCSLAMLDGEAWWGRGFNWQEHVFDLSKKGRFDASTGWNMDHYFFGGSPEASHPPIVLWKDWKIHQQSVKWAVWLGVRWQFISRLERSKFWRNSSGRFVCNKCQFSRCFWVPNWSWFREVQLASEWFRERNWVLARSLVSFVEEDWLLAPIDLKNHQNNFETILSQFRNDHKNGPNTNVFKVATSKKPGDYTQKWLRIVYCVLCRRYWLSTLQI